MRTRQGGKACAGLALLLATAAAVGARSGAAAAAAAVHMHTVPVRRVFATVSTANGTSPPFPCDAPPGFPGPALVFHPVGNPGATVVRNGAGLCQVAGMMRPGEYVVRTSIALGLASGIGASSAGSSDTRAGGVGGAAGAGAGDATTAGTADVVIKAIDLVRPVSNLGNQSLPFMATLWSSANLLDGDHVEGLWQPSDLSSPGSSPSGANNSAWSNSEAACEPSRPAGPVATDTDGFAQGNPTGGREGGAGVVLASGCGLATRSLEARTLNFFRCVHP